MPGDDPPPPPTIVIPDQTPAPLPKPTFKADDGTTFDDMNAYNTYNTNLRNQTFNNTVSDGANKAKAGAATALTSAGFTDPAVLDYWNKYYDAEKQAVPQGDADPSSYFSLDPVNAWLKTGGDNARNGMLNSLSTQLPINFATSAIPSNRGAAAVGSYLDGLQGTVDSELSNAQKRGQVDPTGMAAAQAEEARQRNVGMGHLSSIAQSLATTDQGAIGSQRDAAFTAVNNWKLGDPFVDVNGYLNNINNTVNTDSSNFDNSFAAQADGYNPFDINAILMKAGIGSGPNDAAGGVNAANLGAASDAVKKLGPRGLGTTGPF